MTQRNWAGIIVHQAGEWTSTEDNPERGIGLLFFPSTHVLNDVAKKCDRLVRNFNAPQLGESERARSLTCLGELVYDLTARQHVVAAFGHVPVAQWADARRQGLTLAVWPIAAYLPFVPGPVWMAVTGQFLIDQRREYHSQLSTTFSQLCTRLRRSAGRATPVEELPVCFYEQHDGRETWWEARRNAVVRDEEDDERGRWYPDPRTPSDVIPLEHLRCAISLSEFVTYIVHDPTAEAIAWHTRLRDNLREFDLTATPW